MYPPRVTMTVSAPNIEPRIKLPIQFEGCLDNSQLDMEIHFPLSIASVSCILQDYACTLHYAGSSDIVGSASQSSVTCVRSNVILAGKYFFVGGMGMYSILS